jgi:hypothetical protein
MSAWVCAASARSWPRAVDHELEREQLNRYLDELDGEFGPVPEELIEGYDAQWP